LLVLLATQAVQLRVMRRAAGVGTSEHFGKVKAAKNFTWYADPESRKLKMGGIQADEWDVREQRLRWSEVETALAESPERIAPGRYGFASRASLDAVKLERRLGSDKAPQEAADAAPATHSESRRSVGASSPYNVLWQIAEFGTGIYAEPHKRLGVAGKIPGGGGAWWFGKFPLLGQKGHHFLFPYRSNMDEAQADMQAAVDAIMEHMTQVLAGTTPATS
jgi:hypothetical protein